MGLHDADEDDPTQQNEEAEYVVDLSRRDDNPMRGAVISGRPDAPNSTNSA